MKLAHCVDILVKGNFSAFERAQFLFAHSHISYVFNTRYYHFFESGNK